MPMINCLAFLSVIYIRNLTDKVSRVFGKFYKSLSLFLCTKYYYRDIIIKIPYIAVLYKANKYLQNSSNIDLINFLNWVFSML